MVSISSSKLIRERTKQFCTEIKEWKIAEELFSKIASLLDEEYTLIPDKERIGKCAVYLSRYITKELVQYIKNVIKPKSDYFIDFVSKGFDYGDVNTNVKFLHLILYFFSEFILQFPSKFEVVKYLIEKWADHKEWQIRESTGEVILSALKKIPDKTLKYLSELAKNDNNNLRRLASESLRPRADVKWLRNSTKNDEVLNILTILRKDSSIYVRKSVGNNIKDLSKYMPKKMLKLMENWIKEEKIEVYDELAMEVGLNEEEKQLIWTIKQAMRWIKDRNPEFHPLLEKILGKNYVLYFNEKRNRLAKPVK